MNLEPEWKEWSLLNSGEMEKEKGPKQKGKKAQQNRNTGLWARVWEEGENPLGFVQLCLQASHEDTRLAER